VGGRLPITISKQATPGGDVEFAFQDITTSGLEDRKYKLIQTVVRRVDDNRKAPPQKRKR
jgi:hypothetical protein